ncbi:MAG: DMT family transporter [Acetobacteraceae bacterium]|nr:DMT family transporter [Acetobacteraceae bacterium]
MIELWIPITLGAAVSQSFRTAMQQKLRALLSVNAAGLVRYLYGMPVALAILMISLQITGLPLPQWNWTFLMWCAISGLGQILGTNLLIMAFGYRNFAVGTAYAKTEAAQTSVVALVLIGEMLRPLAWIGIAVGLFGVQVLSLAGRGLKPRQLLAATLQPAALCGLGTGFIFALITVTIKLANQSIDGDSLFIRAMFVLTVTNALQTIMQGGYVALREPAELKKAFSSWRHSIWVGMLSALGSSCWFYSFAIAPIALVRSLGQIEVVFTLLFSRFYLKETLKRSEISGLILVVFSVILILVGR